MDDAAIDKILQLLSVPNALACAISLETGLRISDVLALKTKGFKRRMRVKESKTGKVRTVTMPDALFRLAQAQAGETYVFPGRLDPAKHRTRQAVYSDLVGVAKRLKLTAHVTPHSMRKAYAVHAYRRLGDLRAVQRLLGHKDIATTMIYALADKL